MRTHQPPCSFRVWGPCPSSLSLARVVHVDQRDPYLWPPLLISLSPGLCAMPPSRSVFTFTTNARLIINGSRGGAAAVVSHCASQTPEASIKLLGQERSRGCGSRASHPSPRRGLVYVESGRKRREPKKVKFEEPDTAAFTRNSEWHLRPFY